MRIEDPDGVRIVLVEVPAGHPLRHDPRPALPLGRRPAGRITARSTGKRSSPAPALSAADPDDAPYTAPLPAMRRVFASITIREAPAAAAGLAFVQPAGIAPSPWG
jgi:hypothetical protein